MMYHDTYISSNFLNEREKMTSNNVEALKPHLNVIIRRGKHLFS